MGMGIYGSGMHGFVMRELEIGYRAASYEDNERCGSSAIDDVLFMMYVREQEAKMDVSDLESTHTQMQFNYPHPPVEGLENTSVTVTEFANNRAVKIQFEQGNSGKSEFSIEVALLDEIVNAAHIVTGSSIRPIPSAATHALVLERERTLSDVRYCELCGAQIKGIGAWGHDDNCPNK